MTIRVQNRLNLPASMVEFKVKRSASLANLMAGYGAAEAAWDAFCQKQYKQSLRSVCRKLIDDIKVSINFTGETIIKFRHGNLDKLARCITYGVGELPPSDLIRKIFTTDLTTWL